MRESFAVDSEDGFLLVNGSKVLLAWDGFVLDILSGFASVLRFYGQIRGYDWNQGVCFLGV